MKKKKVSYTISDEWKSFFSKEPGTKYIVATDEGKNLNQIIVDNAVKYINITEGNIKDFAKDAMGELSSKTKVRTEKAVGNLVNISNLPLGYYLIHPEGATEKADGQNSIVSLTSTTPSAEVVVKGTYPTVEKKVDKPTADIGQELTYTLTSKVPDTTGYKEYKFEMTDKPSRGLTITKDSVKIHFGDTDVTDNENIKKEVNDNGLKISFEMLKLKDHVGKEIKVTYKAKLNKEAVITGANPNEVTLEYSNDPHDSEKTDKTTGGTKVFTAKVIVNKVDGKDQKALEGAKFKLKKTADTRDLYYKVNESTKEVTWVEKEGATEVETKIGTDGKATASFDGLAEGIYYLVETKAPDGYNKLTEDKKVEIKVNKEKETVTAIIDGQATVENNSGVELPGTGGMGTTLFAVLGGAIILIALYSLAKGKVKKKGTKKSWVEPVIRLCSNKNYLWKKANQFFFVFFY